MIGSVNTAWRDRVMVAVKKKRMCWRGVRWGLGRLVMLRAAARGVREESLCRMRA